MKKYTTNILMHTLKQVSIKIFYKIFTSMFINTQTLGLSRRNDKMKKITLCLLIFPLILAAIPQVRASGQGTIRIEPHSSYYPLPMMISSPATFNISVVPGGDPTLDPHIFLVMTKDTYNGLSGSVTVNWTGGGILTISSWNGPETDNSKKIPVDNSVGYTVASLKDHLNTLGPIYWAFEPFLGGAPLTQIKQKFTITLPSSATNPRMLVYALGKIGEYDEKTGTILCPTPNDSFNNRVPPTKPGLVVPELATILLAAASFGAFAIYGVTRKKTLHLK